MNVFSCFDGMSCGQIALERLGEKVDNYYASEIDKWAIQVTQANYPATKQLGDIQNIFGWELPKIDLLIGGSPCQGFSFAGKQLNFDDPRSKLFFEFVRIYKELKQINPDLKFLLENVKMKKEYQDVISDCMGVQPIEINSALLSAQNRRRLYWTNISDRIKQPEDLGILLKDIVQPEHEIEERYYIDRPDLIEKIRGLCLNKKAPTQRASTGRCLDDKHNYQIIKINRSGGLKRNQDKSSCLTGGHRGDGNHSDMDILCVAMRGRNPENSSDRAAGAPTEQRLEPKTDGKTNTLTTVGKDNLILLKNKVKYEISCNCGQVFIGTLSDICPKCELIQSGYTNEIIQKDNLILQVGRGFNKGGLHEEKAPTLTSNSWEQNNFLKQNYKLRRLTPIECERLQTVPDNYTDHVSNTQRYKMLGNGWTVDVIYHILAYMNPHFNPGHELW